MSDGEATFDRTVQWKELVINQLCPFSGKKCFKTRKSAPETSIGTCIVKHSGKNLIICPNRLLERKQVFMDCIHQLSKHEPGNELHVISEVKIPGGSVDFILVSLKRGTVADFIGIEFQALDTIGSIWPERQKLLMDLEISEPDSDPIPEKLFGMNWKMTAKTILLQMHHKASSLESMKKHLVLIMQNPLLEYIQKEFDSSAFRKPDLSDSVHIHSYSLKTNDTGYLLELDSRYSTDSGGIMKCLGLNADSSMNTEEFEQTLFSKISDDTLLTI